MPRVMSILMVNVLMAACATDPIPVTAPIELQTSACYLDGSTIMSSDGLKRIDIGATTLHDFEDLGYDDSAVLDKDVHAFAITDGKTAFYLSSYKINREGSAQLAIGSDIFLAYDEDRGMLIGAPLVLRASKYRTRIGGCWAASAAHFYLADVNGDGAIDIGRVQEVINCSFEYDETEGVDRPVRKYSVGSLDWHVFDARDAWKETSVWQNECPDGQILSIGWPGLASSPVEFAIKMQPMAERDAASGPLAEPCLLDSPP